MAPNDAAWNDAEIELMEAQDVPPWLRYHTRISKKKIKHHRSTTKFFPKTRQFMSAEFQNHISIEQSSFGQVMCTKVSG